SGKLDTSFGSGGKVFIALAHPDDRISNPIIDSQGRILVWVGAKLLRYTAKGKFDKRLTNAGVVSYAAPFGEPILPDGREIVPDGTNIKRLMPDGSLDLSFGKRGKVAIPFTVSGLNDTTLPLLPGFPRIAADGSITDTVSGGDPEYELRAGVIRITADGKLDTHFGDHGLAGESQLDSSILEGLAITPAGKIVVFDSSDEGEFFLNQLNPAGSDDGILVHRLDSTSLGIEQQILIPSFNSDFSITGGHNRNFIFATATLKNHHPDKLELIRINSVPPASIVAGSRLNVLGTPSDDTIIVQAI